MAPRAAKDPLKQWRKDAETLSYEEALQAADLLLHQLQSDTLPLDDLQQTHQRAQIYLEHCDALLGKAEQNVLELDTETMTTSPLVERPTHD